ncbi:MAG: M48 family metalloprotease, partial [Pseudomonadota bacterium]
MRLIWLIAVLGVAGCTLQAPRTDPTPVKPDPIPQTKGGAPQNTPQLTARQAARNFVDVVETMEPVVERACRDLTQNLNCDFRIVLDDRPNQPPNAFQTLEDSGRPVLGFTLSLLRDVRNKDEIAFVFGHEAAHHIRGHLPRQQQNAQAGAAVFGILAAGLGIDPASSGVLDIGAAVGARSYSKEFELEADQLGAILTQRSGFDPVLGAEYFNRIPDP